MRKTQRGNARLRMRILLPYAVAVLALTAIVGAYMGYQNAARAKEENRTLLGNALSASAAQLDTIFAELDAITYDILANNALYPYTAFSSGYSAMLAVNALQSYRTSNSFLSDIVLYYGEEVALRYNDDVRFFTAGGAYDSRTFFEYIHPLEGWGSETFQGLVSELTGARVLFPARENGRTGRQDYLLYLVPASRLSFAVNGRGVIAYLVSRKSLDAILAQTASRYQGSLRVTDEGGQLIYQTGDDAPQTPPDGPSGELQYLTLPDGGIQVVLKSAARNLRYTLTLPGVSLPSPGSAALLSLLPVLTLLILGGAAGAYALSGIVYRPISQLANLLRPGDEPRIDSLSGIVTSIQSLKERKDTLEERTEKQTELSRAQYLHMLLHRSFVPGEDAPSHLSEVTAYLNAPQYLVLLGRVHAQGDPFRPRALCLERLGGMTPPCLAIAMEEASAFALLTGIACADAARDRAQAVFDTLSDALKPLGAELTMSMGGPMDRLTDAHLAFEDAREALSELFLYGRGALLGAKPAPLPAPESEGWYPLAEENDLQNALFKGEEESAKRIAAGIVERLRRSCLPSRVARAICQNVVLHLATALRGARMGESLDAAAELLSDQDRTLSEFAQALDDACHAVCAELLKARALDDGDQLSRRIETYLQENQAQADLSLTSIAEAFGLSEGHVSRSFKERAGMSVMQYLSTLRLRHAQTLLRDTELTLDEVIAQCGYNDKSNFIRTFKKAFFVTPMQYRKIARDTPPE